MAAITKLYTLCTLLRASLFAYSASVQLNDPDWYFWFPLYLGAGVVNLVIWAVSSKAIKLVAEAALWLGIFLFIKVTAESASLKGASGFLSLDLSKRVIREKVGSGLVIISMLLQWQHQNLHQQKLSHNKVITQHMLNMEWQFWWDSVLDFLLSSLWSKKVK